MFLLGGTLCRADEPFAPESPFHRFHVETVEPNVFNPDSSQNNYVGIVDRGDYALQLRTHLIRSAVESIDIQTFIWANDECGAFVFHELLEAAHRGVKVRLLIDHIASIKNRDAIVYLLTASENIEIAYYRPAAKQLKSSLPMTSLYAVIFAGSINQRMHNKLFIIDGALAMTGGRNFDNSYYNYSTTLNFKDRDAFVMGPLVRECQVAFDRYWNDRRSVPSHELLDVIDKLDVENINDESIFTEVPDDEYFQTLNANANDAAFVQEQFIDTLYEADSVRFLVDKPGKNTGWWLLRMWSSGRVTKELKKVIHDTQEELVIQSPYLIVNRWARHEFRKIRKRHPDARFVVSTNSFAAADHLISYSANYRLRTPYIRKLKFEIHEFKPYPAVMQTDFPQYEMMKARAAAEGGVREPYFSIHAKSFVMDGHTSFIGTYNLDPRSFNLNSEEGFLIKDADLARDLRATILRDTLPENAWVIAPRHDLMGRELNELNSFIEWISRILPIDVWPLRYTSSYELKEGMDPLSPWDPNFYDHYNDIGRFPGSELITSNEVLTSFYKTFGKFATPAL